MLKNKISKLQKEVLQRYPQTPNQKGKKSYKYSLEDWTDEELRAAVFPEGRDFFDPTDEGLIKKWDQTNWLHAGFLKRLSVPELKALEYWLEQREKQRGEADVKRQGARIRKANK